MSDYLLRAIANDNKMRVIIMESTEIVKTAKALHGTSVTATAAFGRVLTGISLMGAMQKNEGELLTISIKGDGPLEGVVATSDISSNVKGYIFNPSAELPPNNRGKIDVGGGIGKGILTVIKEIGKAEPSVGQVELISGEIAEDLTYYFAQSEQIQSAVVLGVLVDKNLSVKKAGGYILQILPDATDEDISAIENIIVNSPPLTTLLDEGNTPDDILEMLVGSFGYKILTRNEDVKYHCGCDKNKMKSVLKSIGETELQTILEEDKKAELLCHFCNSSYDFAEGELGELLCELQGENSEEN